MKNLSRARLCFHRSWRGAPLKHGTAEYFYADGVLAIRQPWRDGVLHGVETWFDQQGRLLMEQTWRDGERQGPFRLGNGTEWLYSGQYENSKLNGDQREATKWFNGEFVIRISTWDHDQELGSYRWETLQGESLQTGTYDFGWLTEWNGEPVHDYLHEWSVSGKITSDRIARALRADTILETHTGPFSDFDTIHIVEDEYRVYILRDPSLPELKNSLRPLFHRTPLSRDLVTVCIPWGLAIDWRYENLYVVPAEDVGHWRDATGVAELDVSGFPKLAAIWNKPFRVGSRYPDEFHPLLDELFVRWPKECGVELDLKTHFPEWQQRLHDEYSSSVFGVDNESPDEIYRSLHAWLGSTLYHLGLQCELQGNRLVILPHWSQRKLPN